MLSTLHTKHNIGGRDAEPEPEPTDFGRSRSRRKLRLRLRKGIQLWQEKTKRKRNNKKQPNSLPKFYINNFRTSAINYLIFS